MSSCARRVLGGEPTGCGSGWRCCSSAGWPPGCGVRQTALRDGPAADARPGGRAIAGGIDAELVGVLASMTLACRGAGVSGVSVETATKVTGAHLARTAYLYVRQSTLRQVLTNTESATRQYALRQRAIALGWPAEQIVVIDCDQGQSGASAADREGFQRLVAEVGMGRAGIVLGLEVSRLARNNADWHRLLEICACGHADLRRGRPL